MVAAHTVFQPQSCLRDCEQLCVWNELLNRKLAVCVEELFLESVERFWKWNTYSFLHAQHPKVKENGLFNTTVRCSYTTVLGWCHSPCASVSLLIYPVSEAITLCLGQSELIMPQLGLMRLLVILKAMWWSFISRGIKVDLVQDWVNRNECEGEREQGKTDWTQILWLVSQHTELCCFFPPSEGKKEKKKKTVAKWQESV